MQAVMEGHSSQVSRAEESRQPGRQGRVSRKADLTNQAGWQAGRARRAEQAVR
jgi:hypothetical protein